MLNLRQQQKLQQKLSPQQIQYIKLLQLPTLALEQRIKTELESNPLLEEGLEEEEETISEDNPVEDALRDDREEAGAEKEREADVREEKGDSDDEYDWSELLDNADDLYGHKARVDQSAEEDHRDMPMPARTGIIEHLVDQLSFLQLTQLQALIAEQIIGSIDEDGILYLATTGLSLYVH